MEINLPLRVSIPWSQRFSFAAKRQEKRERERERERSGERKPLVAGDANLTIMLRCVSRESINKQPITTHLSVNTSQSEYAIRFLQSGGRLRS